MSQTHFTNSPILKVSFSLTTLLSCLNLLTFLLDQIKSYVFDVIRSSIPGLLIDDAFASKDTLAHAVRDRLAALMAEYGYEIIAALVVDLNPDRQVKIAMNEINGESRNFSFLFLFSKLTTFSSFRG